MREAEQQRAGLCLVDQKDKGRAHCLSVTLGFKDWMLRLVPAMDAFLRGRGDAFFLGSFSWRAQPPRCFLYLTLRLCLILSLFHSPFLLLFPA